MKLIVALIGLIFISCTTNSEISVDIDYRLVESIEKIDLITKSELKGYWNNSLADNFIKSDIEVHRIVYRTDSPHSDSPAVASGAILIPRGSKVKGLISIQHATFFADDEAPSENGDFSVVSRKSIFSSNGYIVLLPDYYGYGVDKETIHYYHHAESLAESSKSMMAASIEFLQKNNISFNDKIFLAGYSEGAYATAALQQEIELDHSFELMASSLGAGAYNLKASVDYFAQGDTLDSACLPCNAFLIQAYNHKYDLGQPMQYYFNEPYAQLVADGLLLGTFSGSQVNAQLPLNPKELYKSSFLEDYSLSLSPLHDVLIDNNIHNWIIKTPTLLTHGSHDNVVPYFNSFDLATLNKDNGVVVFQNLEGRNHFDGIFDWGVYTMNYFDGF